MSLIGGDLAAMSALANNFRGWSGQVADLNRQITAAVDGNVGSTWTGAVALRFGDQWRSQFQVALAQLADALEGNAQVVQSRRDAFDSVGNLG